MTLPELDDQITVMMGGRAAEESVYSGVISTGAGDDLQRASELIRQMVMRFGMSERLGHLTYGASYNASFLRLPFMSDERNYSDECDAIGWNCRQPIRADKRLTFIRRATSERRLSKLHPEHDRPTVWR